MNWSVLSKQLELAVGAYVESEDLSRSDVIGLLHEKAGSSRSTVRQDLGGYIKRPDPTRLKAYSDVLGWPLRSFLKAAAADGVEYDLSIKRGRESARPATDIGFDGTDDTEAWEDPAWSDWKEALGIEGQWDDAPEEARQTVASTTVFGQASAETYSDVSFYPLTTAGQTLVFGALDSAWQLAGRSPDPEGLRSTLETLAQQNFDHSFREDGKTMSQSVPLKADPSELAVGDKVGWSTSSDEINTYGTVREIQREGTASPDGSDYSLDASDESPVFWVQIYDVEEGEHEDTETIHRASELTKIGSFPDSKRSKSTHEDVDLSPPSKIVNAAEAFLEAKEEGMVPDSCGTGTGTKRARKIAGEDLTWKDFLTRDNGTPIPAYLNSHEGDVSAGGPPTDWGEEGWSDCGNAQYAAWGFYPEWFKDKANELARAMDEEEPYKSQSQDFRGAPSIMIDDELDQKVGLGDVTPFTDKIMEDDTEFKGGADAEVKDVDKKRNIVEVYYAAWTKDAADDRFQKGAFEESIKKYGPQADNQRIVQLNQHSVFEPVGRPIKMVEDDHGLKSQTLIAETSLGEDILELYAAGVLTEHSVGFKRLEEEETEDGTNVIKKALLLEGSNVTWGANSDTPFVGFKDAKSAVNDLTDHLSSLRSALKEGLTMKTARKVEHGIATAERHLERVMQQVAPKAEEAEHANADAITMPDLEKAVQNFRKQIGAIRKGNAPEKSDQDGESGIEIPDISLGDQSKDEGLDIDTDKNLFGD